jgi:hypothetical protein
MGAGVGKEFTDLAQGSGAPAAALLVHEAVLRLRRAPAGRVALVLHLSRLVPPAPRPYHVRIARALLQDTAARHEGQVFTLGNQDMVLLCAASASPGGALGLRNTLATDPLALPAILLRLLRADMKPAGALVSLWPLDDAGDELAAYTRARLREAELMPAPTQDRMSPHNVRTKVKAMTMEEDFAGQTGLACAVGQVVDQSTIADLLQRQTAIAFGPGIYPRDIPGDGPRDIPGDGPGALHPIFTEVSFSIAALEARLAGEERGYVGGVAADPFLFRHLASRLDERMLKELSQDRRPDGGGGMLGALVSGGRASPARALSPGESPGPALHLNLAVPAILSEAFARLAIICTRREIRVGVEISLLEAMVDLAAFERARRVLADHGMVLVLDGVSHVAMQIVRPWALRPDLLKLDWSPRLLDLPGQDAAILEAAIAQTDPARVVLHRAETEAALRWGVARGIRRFQGRHVDAMLSASRLVACAHAGDCSLRQCVERAASMSTAGRIGCRNLALLDRGTPEPAIIPHLGSGVVAPRVSA